MIRPCIWAEAGVRCRGAGPFFLCGAHWARVPEAHRDAILRARDDAAQRALIGPAVEEALAERTQRLRIPARTSHRRSAPARPHLVAQVARSASPFGGHAADVRAYPHPADFGAATVRAVVAKRGRGGENLAVVELPVGALSGWRVVDVGSNSVERALDGLGWPTWTRETAATAQARLSSEVGA